VRLDLARSGIPWAPAETLGPLRLSDPHAPERFAEALASRYGLPADEVLPTLGTSQALWLVCAALLEPGDRVLVEAPFYEPLRWAPEAAGARVDLFLRPAPDHALDVEALGACLDASVRMVLVSNRHNPSGAMTRPDRLGELARLCEAQGATLLVDEVYGDFSPGPPASARSAGANVVAISSMTKRWGLGWARVGWIAASPEVLRGAVTHIRYETGQNGTAHAAIGLAALERIEELTQRADAIAGEGEAQVHAWVKGHPRLSWTPPGGGIFGLVRVEGAGDLRPRIERLCDEEGVVVAPGSFFGVPDAFRIGWTEPEEKLAEGLARLGQIL